VEPAGSNKIQVAVRGRERSLTLRRFGLLTLLSLTVAACAHTPSRKDREAAEIHYQLGADALRSGRNAEATKEFDLAIQLDDRHPAAHLGRGLAFQLYGKLPEAEADYRRAIALDPGLSDAHNALGQLLARTGRFDEAVSEFDRALEDMTYRDAYAVRCNKGFALYEMGKHEEGLAQVRTCLSLAPRYCQGHRYLGQMQLGEGRVKEALQSFTRYAELCDQVADAWYQLALARMRAGDPEKAREAFQRCESVAAGRDPVGEECRQKVQALR
jgi:type IV pilus biogenesis/stability protein PilW